VLSGASAGGFGTVFNYDELRGLVDSLCGVPCRSDFALGYAALASRFPADRFALTSSLRDQTIRSYLGLTPEAFETALLAAAEQSIEPTANFEYFFVGGESHTMLGSPAAFISNGVDLFTWLNRMISDDASWASTRP